jgi:hypothetical protein
MGWNEMRCMAGSDECGREGGSNNGLMRIATRSLEGELLSRQGAENYIWEAGHGMKNAERRLGRRPIWA